MNNAPTRTVPGMDTQLLCFFEPIDWSSGDIGALPSGSLTRRKDGTYRLTTDARGVKRIIKLGELSHEDAYVLTRWLETWEFARVCDKYLLETPGAPNYTAFAVEDLDELHLNPLRRGIVRLRATPQTASNGKLSIPRVEAGAPILTAPPGPEEVTSLVTGSELYRYIFYTPAARTVQQGAMTPIFVIPEEVHADAEQYFLVKSGHGWSVVDGKVSELQITSAFWVYRGQRHTIINDPLDPLHLFVAYSPAHHPAGRINSMNVDVLEPK